MSLCHGARGLEGAKPIIQILSTMFSSLIWKIRSAYADDRSQSFLRRLLVDNQWEIPEARSDLNNVEKFGSLKAPEAQFRQRWKSTASSAKKRFSCQVHPRDVVAKVLNEGCRRKAFPPALSSIHSISPSKVSPKALKSWKPQSSHPFEAFNLLSTSRGTFLQGRKGFRRGSAQLRLTNFRRLMLFSCSSALNLMKWKFSVL